MSFRAKKTSNFAPVSAFEAVKKRTEQTDVGVCIRNAVFVDFDGAAS